MEYENDSTERVLRLYKECLRHLGKVKPGTADASIAVRNLAILNDELRNRGRAVGLIKQTPLTGRRHPKPAFPSKS